MHRLPHQQELVDLFRQGLSDADFSRLSRHIFAICGIRMPPHKKTMLEARLRRRLRALGLPTFSAYCDHLFTGPDPAGEVVQLIDAVTTNKTDFFREPAHFSYLLDRVLPHLAREDGCGFDRPFRLWSAGCATGEEPYTLAMVLSEFVRKNVGFNFEILATDISTRVLEKAALGIYAEEKVAPVAEEYRRRYLLRSRNPGKKQVRIAPDLRHRVEFRRLNFMDDDYGLRERFDAIFCRNVIIYFDRPTQQTFLERLCRHLGSGRYLFTGHSETLHGLNLPLKQKAPSVYVRNDLM